MPGGRDVSPRAGRSFRMRPRCHRCAPSRARTARAAPRWAARGAGGGDGAGGAGDAAGAGGPVGAGDAGGAAGPVGAGDAGGAPPAPAVGLSAICSTSFLTRSDAAAGSGGPSQLPEIKLRRARCSSRHPAASCYFAEARCPDIRLGCSSCETVVKPPLCGCLEGTSGPRSAVRTEAVAPGCRRVTGRFSRAPRRLAAATPPEGAARAHRRRR